ncbi:hypothetical protein DL765_011724 [Monosporascus sp. GIB2]|nr:hypothetical protein DL765_011724 [Monosporascus sp. GIB2]
MGDYARVNALMLSWKEIDDPTERKEFKTQLQGLADEFRAYRFEVEEYEIESERPYQKLSRRFGEFLQHDQEGTLLILYYGGHGLNNRDSHCIWLRDNPEDTEESENPKVNWSTLQSLFLDDCICDVLFLLDCCYAGASAKQTSSKSNVEAIAAAGFEQVAPLRGSDSFTTFLTEVLKEVRKEDTSIVASVLARRVSALLNSPQASGKGTRVTPQHFPLHNGKTFIEIAPVLPLTLDSVPNGDILQRRRTSMSELPFHAQSRTQERRESQGSSSRKAQDSLKWGDALVDDHRHAKAVGFTDGGRHIKGFPPPLPGRPGPHPPQRGPPLAPQRGPPRPMAPRTPKSSAASRVVSRMTPRMDSSSIYARYPVDSHQIRVLSIKPFKENYRNEPIVCTIKPVILGSSGTGRAAPQQDAYTYKALSWYCRHNAPWNAELTILPEYVRLPIPNELEAALHDLRETDKEIEVWVYQVCIDLDNQREADEQTLLVPAIFRHAAEVIIWPGPEDQSSATALAFVPGIIDLRNIDELVIGGASPPQTTPGSNTARLASPGFRGFGKPQWQNPHESYESAAAASNWSALDSPLPRTPTKSPMRMMTSDVPEKWMFLVEFMTRPYFGRRWAFLEVALARSAKIYCGEHRLSWSDFCDAVTLLGSRFDEVRLLLEMADTFGSMHMKYGQLTDLRALGAYSFAEASRDLFPRQSDGSIVGSCRLEKMVSTLPALRSWHPNAVIYALLPLASDADQWEERSLTPSKAYQHFVHHCAHISGSIDVICRPWAPTQSELDKHPTDKDDKLPSWVCQIDKHPFGEGGHDVPGRRNGEVFAGSPDNLLYNTCKGSRASPVFGHPNEEGTLLQYDGTMTVSGFRVGPIEKLYPRAADGIILMEWIRAFGWRQERIVPDHLWRTLVADRGPGGTPAPAWYHRACHYWLNYAGGDDITYQMLKAGKHSSMAVQYLMRVRSVIWSRRLFTIKYWNGRTLYGLAPRETDEGDFVCILDGCSVPVMLRDNRDHWTLVGECFVYGIMDGEAIDARNGTAKVQEFLLR